MASEISKIEKTIFLISLLKNKYFRKLSKRLILRIFKDFSRIKIMKVEDKYLVSFFIPPIPSIAFNRCLISLINNKDSLLNCHISVTNKCLYDCKICSNYYRNKKEPSLNDIKQIIKKLQDKGVPKICFTGGEPLLREDLPEIIKSVGDKSVTYVYTTGNGFDEKKAEKLKKAGLFGIAISLDSHKSEVNDFLKGYNGAFENAINAIKISKKFGFYTIVQTVVNNETINELKEFLNFLKILDVDDVLVVETIPCGKAIENTNLLINSIDREKIKITEVLANREKKLPKVTSYARIESNEFFGCIGGYNFLYVDAGGEVCPCDLIPLSFGNILKEDFEVIWKRIRKIFSEPSQFCFMLKYHEKIKEEFKGKFPFSYKETKKICRDYCPEIIPRYYSYLPKKLDF